MGVAGKSSSRRVSTTAARQNKSFPRSSGRSCFPSPAISRQPMSDAGSLGWRLRSGGRSPLRTEGKQLPAYVPFTNGFQMQPGQYRDPGGGGVISWENSIAVGSAPRREAGSQPINQSVRPAVSRASRQADSNFAGKFRGLATFPRAKSGGSGIAVRA